MQHETFIRTRFCESDAFGHINNVSFFIYLEQARVDFFMDAQILENLEDWSFVVASAHCDYKKQAFIHQSLVISTWVSHIGNTSVVLKHKILDQINKELIAEGEVVLVAFSVSAQKPAVLTDEMKEKLQIYAM